MKRRVMSLVAVLLMLGILAGCAGTGAPAAEEPPAVPEAPEAPPSEEPLKVAALLSGPINDMGWNASAYEGLLALEAEFGCEINYAESVEQSDMEETFRAFALQGYDVIFGHGFQFGDAATRVAEEFPDTHFVVISSDISNGTNLGSANTVTEDQGFIAGALAALTSESGVVGGIGGVDIPPIRGPILGFMAGAEYVNPDIEVIAVLTGSNDDVAKAKETAVTMIENGADVIFANANQAGLGSIEACKEAGVWAVGSNQDQNPIAPEAVFQSVIKSTPKLFTYVVEQMINGTYEARFHGLGVREGAIFLSDWHGYDAQLPEVKAEIEKIIEGLKDGSITYDVSKYNL